MNRGFTHNVIPAFEPGSQKNGFTLIELVVTMAVSGIFFTLAMNLYTQAVKGQLAFTKKDAAYMQRSVDIAKTKRMLQEHPGKCVDGIYVLDSTDNVIPASTHPLQCKELKRGRIVVYNNLGSWVLVVHFFKQKNLIS